MKISFREIASVINGFSTPVFGVSWNPPESERKIIRELIIYLEDRRALFTPFDFEFEDHVALSIIDIRKTITSSIQRLPDSSKAIPILKAMRLNCNKYLSSRKTLRHSFPEYMINLGSLRTVFGYYLAQLSVIFGIDIEGDLEKILPPEFKKTIVIKKKK